MFLWFFLFPFSTKWKAQGLEVLWEKGEGSGHALTICSKAPSLPHSPTHSTVQYITIHPSPCALLPPKYHVCSMKKTYLKTLNEMCDVIYNWWFIYKWILYDGDGRKTTKYTKTNTKNKGKNSPLCWVFPSPSKIIEPKLPKYLTPRWERRDRNTDFLRVLTRIMVILRWLQICHLIKQVRRINLGK